MNHSTKLCRRCQQEKPLAEFYKRSGWTTPDNPPTRLSHYHTECKECYKDRRRNYKPPKSGNSRVYSEQLTINYLRKHGIPTRNANKNNFPHSDIVSWGCVPIEVKFSQLKMVNGNQRFAFVMTPKQSKYGFRAELVVLVCEYEPGMETFHVFDAQHPVFYIKGKMKTGVTYTPDVYKIMENLDRVVLTPDMMDAAQDAFWLIEQKRLEYAEQLKVK